MAITTIGNSDPVQTRQIIHTGAPFADRYTVAEAGTGSMPVVVMQPVRQMRHALVGIVVRSRIHPVVECRQDQPFGLAIGARPVRARSPVFESQTTTGPGKHA